MSITDIIIEHVRNELERQQDLKRAGKFEYTPADEDCPELTRLAVLTEEVGEVARAVQSGDEENKFEELVQVAAVAVSWLLSMEKRAHVV